MKKNLLFLLFLSVLSFAQVKTVSLNSSFINNGVLTLNTKDEDKGAWTRITSDNKILFMYPDDVNANDKILTRRLANGTIDTSFGNNGYIYTKDLFIKHNEVVILYDKAENIYLATTIIDSSNSNTFYLKVVKFSSNGIKDNSFGNNGEFTLNNIDIENDDTIYVKTASLENGNLLFGIYDYNNNTGTNSIICLNSNGSIVTNFGNNGILSTGKWISNFITTNNGLYIVSEDHSNDYSYWTFYIEKFDETGIKDNNFNTISSTSKDISCHLKSDNSGNLITLINYYPTSNNLYSSVKKYDPLSGNIISTFGTNGSIELNEVALIDLTTDTDNNLILAGGKHLGNDVFNPYLTKYTSNGVLDTNFNQTGFYEELSNSLGYIDNVRLLNNDIIISGVTDDYYKVFLADYLLTDNLSVKENTKENISIFPNPVQDVLYIKTSEKVLDAKIYDEQGRLIKFFSNATNSLPVNNLQKGVYFIDIKTSKNNKKIKFIKQ
jgi:hypothetical protein